MKEKYIKVIILALSMEILLGIFLFIGDSICWENMSNLNQKTNEQLDNQNEALQTIQEENQKIKEENVALRQAYQELKKEVTD